MAIVVIALFVVIGLGIDGVRAAQGLANADAIAEETARTAAQSLDTAALRRGTAAVDPTRAIAAARTYLAAAGVDGTVTVVAPQRVRVQVRITRPTVLLGLLGQAEIVSEGTADAQLVAIPPGGAP
ncbi:hypothetical protein GCM10009608_33140 [Pseudonocardia alaniniphila]